MLSESQFSNQSMTVSKEAMPEKVKYDGPGELSIAGNPNKFAAHINMSIPKPGFSE
jgi:hypothetical protein